MKKHTHSTQEMVLPRKLGRFSFIRTLAEGHRGAYSIGLYGDRKGKQGVVKICKSRWNVMARRSLRNEISAYASIKNSQTVRVPALLAEGIDKGRLYCITEYTKGKELAEFPAKTRAEVYSTVDSFLRAQKIPRSRSIVRRGPAYWLLVLPYLVVRALIRHPLLMGSIIRSAVRVLSAAYPLLSRKQRSIVHRDLSDKNVLISEGKPVLIDLQLASVADPLIDTAVLYFGYHRDAEFINALENSSVLKRIRADKRQNSVFSAYCDIFALYDLGLQKNRVDWEALHGESRVGAKGNSIGKRLGTGAFVMCMLLIPVIILTLSIRGNQGNPSEADLNRHEWKEGGPFELSPERGRFALIYSLVENKSFHFSLPLAQFVVPDLGFKNGKYVSLFAPGVSYLAIPGYLLGKMGGISQVGAYATSAVFAVINYILIVVIAKKLGAKTSAGFLGGLIFLFATPAFAYAVNLYQHHVSTFLILLSILIVITSHSYLAYALLWILCASSIPVDYPNLFLMLPIAIFGASKLLEVRVGKVIEIKTSVAKWTSVAAVIFPLLFFLWFNKSSYDNPLQFSGTVKSVASIGADGLPVDRTGSAIVALQTAQTTEVRKKSALRFFNPRNMINGLNILLMSPDRGTLIFTPVVIIGILGMIALYRKRRAETVMMLGVITMNVVLYGMWGDPWGGWAFGARYLIPAYAVMAVFVAVALTAYRRNILMLTAFVILAGYSIYVNTAGALSSSANPPKVQVLHIESLSGRRERYSFDRNIEFLQANDSKSFIFQTYLKDRLTAMEYYRLIAGSITGIVVIAAASLFSPRRKQV